MPTNPDWMSWRNSTPRQIVMLDLINGFLPLDPAEMSPEEAWEIHCRHVADFAEAVFSQFKARLADHRRLARRDLHAAAHEAAASAHDRLLFPRQPTNERGELVFDLHPAKRLLRDDLRNQRHVGLTPKAFRLTRADYQEFDLEVFRQRIYQEIRRGKFVNWLNERREQGYL
jgi:hypothetical protein